MSYRSLHRLSRRTLKLMYSLNLFVVVAVVVVAAVLAIYPQDFQKMHITPSQDAVLTLCPLA